MKSLVPRCVAMALCLSILTFPGCTVSSLSSNGDHPIHAYAPLDGSPMESLCTGGNIGSAECAQQSAMQGRACLTLVHQQSISNTACPPPTDTARQRLLCAVASFDPVRLGHYFPPDQLIELHEMHAQALYCVATLKSLNDGLSDAREAARELEMPSLPADAKREQLAAAAELYVATSDQAADAERCSAALRAIARSDRGLQYDPKDDMRRGLLATRDHASSIAAHIASCPTT